MKKYILITLLSLCAIPILFAQQDPMARAALEKTVAMMKRSAVKIVFSTTVESANKKRTNLSGTLVIMGNKYKASINGTESYFDGKTQWVFSPENNEVTVSTISAKDQKQMNPLSVLSQYSGKNTKIIFNREGKTTSNQVAIDLFPTVKSANEFRILVKLNKQNNALQSLQLFDRDGSKTVVNVKSFRKISADNKTFAFDVKAHPKVNVNDLR